MHHATAQSEPYFSDFADKPHSIVAEGQDLLSFQTVEPSKMLSQPYPRRLTYKVRHVARANAHASLQPCNPSSARSTDIMSIFLGRVSPGSSVPCIVLFFVCGLLCAQTCSADQSTSFPHAIRTFRSRWDGLRPTIGII